MGSRLKRCAAGVVDDLWVYASACCVCAGEKSKSRERKDRERKRERVCCYNQHEPKYKALFKCCVFTILRNAAFSFCNKRCSDLKKFTQFELFTNHLNTVFLLIWAKQRSCVR